MSIFTTFAKQSMINQLSNPINRNRSAAKISKVMSSSGYLVQCSSEESLGNTNKIHLPNRRSEKETTLIWKQNVWNFCLSCFLKSRSHLSCAHKASIFAQGAKDFHCSGEIVHQGDVRPVVPGRKVGSRFETIWQDPFFKEILKAAETFKTKPGPINMEMVDVLKSPRHHQIWYNVKFPLQLLSKYCGCTKKGLEIAVMVG